MASQLDALPRARRWTRSPCGPKMFSSSTGSAPALVTACGMRVSNSAASPAVRVKSLSPRVRRSRQCRRRHRRRHAGGRLRRHRGSRDQRRSDRRGHRRRSRSAAGSAADREAPGSRRSADRNRRRIAPPGRSAADGGDIPNASNQAALATSTTQRAQPVTIWQTDSTRGARVGHG
jgi:hypothetical protein